MSKKEVFILTIVTIVIVTMIVAPEYTANRNPLTDVPNLKGKVSGFYLGLWHGVIIIPALTASFFNDLIGIYDVTNNGSPYNAGFVLGIIINFIIAKALFTEATLYLDIEREKYDRNFF